MKAIILEKPGQFRMGDVQPPDEPGPGEAIVRVHRVGICGTDLHAFQGDQTFDYCPIILGHELSVEVVAIVDNDVGLAVGDRCAVEPYVHCGRCIACRRGKPNCCVNLTVLGVHVDGGMCELISVPIAKLHKSEILSWDQLALVEMLGIGAHAVHRAGLGSGEPVLIIGAGPIGLSVTQFVRVTGAEIIVMDINEKRLEFCRRTMQIEHAVAASDEPLHQLREILSGELPTAVFDCTGNPESMAASFGFVAHGGKLIFVGHFPGEVTFHDRDFHIRELTLLGSRNATSADLERVLKLLEEGRIDVTSWITHRVQFADMIEVFPRWLDPDVGVVKAIVEW